jgi:fumarate reductase (CoM/CoB) subunit B
MKELNTTVTWHDPCHLGRGQGIKGQPRDILERL